MCNCKTPGTMLCQDEVNKQLQINNELVLKFYSDLKAYCYSVENNLVDGNIRAACCQMGVLRERLEQRVREKRVV